jgi:hypothetical protein
MPTFAAPLFTATHHTAEFLFDQAEFRTVFRPKQNLVLPLTHDSEWNNAAIDDFLTSNEIQNRFHLSTQVKHIFDKPVCFFTEKAIKETGYEFLLPMKNDFIVCDYLEQLGISSNIFEDESENKLPYLDLYLYSFFGIVDIPLLGKKGTAIDDAINAALTANQIKHDKRLTTDWNRPISIPVTIQIADVDNVFHSYRLRLFFIDISALHGNKGYKTVCQNVGIDVSAKSLMDEYKSDMLTGLKLYPNEFIEYSINDLNVYDALVAFNAMMKDIYKDLGLSEFFIIPKLTIGSTDGDIVSAAIYKWQEIPATEYHFKEKNKLKRKETLTNMMGLSSADYLRTQVIKSNVYLLGKIHGGRCHNNNPLFRHLMDAIADYDFAGAYASIMKKLPFFIGKPWIYNAIDEKEMSLKNFLKYNESDFDDWHYVIYVSTNELLEKEQDFLVSWLNPKSGKLRLKGDNGEYSYIPIAEYKSGDCRIFKKQVINCPITSDTVKFIRSLSKSARDDLMNKLIVKSAIGYKRSEKDKDWQSINLGEMLINSLMDKRIEYKKLFKETGESRYNSMQELYKLVMNTVYGVMCSRHFITSNVVVANQITQTIRLGMYLMEKGLNLQGSITDGCMGSLNTVVYPKPNRTVKLDALVGLYKLETARKIHAKHMSLGSLDNAKKITLIWNKLDVPIKKENKVITHTPELKIEHVDRIDSIKDAVVEYVKESEIERNVITNVNAWIDEKAWLHLKFLFPDFAYLFDFLKIETKDVYDSCIYHGAANYVLSNPNYDKYAMRGYSGKKGTAIGIEYDSETDSLVRLDTYDNKSIPEVHLSQLKETMISKLPAFAKTKILKSKEYKLKNFNKKSNLVCGDDVIEVGLPNYFSLSQFTFQTIKQYNNWLKIHSRLKGDSGETFETFFTDKDGRFDYDAMIKTACEMVDNGIENPIKYVTDKTYRRKTEKHKRFKTKLEASAIRNKLTFVIVNDDDNENSDSIELED